MKKSIIILITVPVLLFAALMTYALKAHRQAAQTQVTAAEQAAQQVAQAAKSLR